VLRSILIILTLLSVPSILTAYSNELSINSRNFTIDIASSHLEKAMGLMYVENIPENYGLLFVYKKPQEVGIWMKNTLISLDILWIDKSNRIVHIETNTLPNSTQIMRPNKKVTYVLEVISGTVKKYNIKVGDIIKLTELE
jgi:uncharacterized membrane protein (UPF0127 family)